MSIWESLGDIGGNYLDFNTLGMFGHNTRKQANSQQAIAEAQLAEARRTQQMAVFEAKETPSELLAMQRQSQMYDSFLAQQQTQLKRQAELLGKIDPSIMQAFQGMQDIMSGKESSFTQPLRNRLDIEKQRQDSRLRASMGSGYQSSSAGLQADALFAQSAAEAQQSANVQALGALAGVANTGIGASGALQSQTNALGAMAEGANQNMFGMQNQIQNRKINALLGTNTTQYQGASNIGALVNSSLSQQRQDALYGAAASVAGAYFTGGGTLPTQAGGAAQQPPAKK